MVGERPLQILVVCTANVCRSPVAEAFLAGHLSSAGRAASVRSAGTDGGRLEVHRDTRRAAAEAGLDLDAHRSRAVDRRVLDEDGADLVLTMTREHLRAVVGLEPGVWPRAFTLKELVRRGSEIGPVSAHGELAAWRRAAAEGRRAADLIRPDPRDDVADPYGAALAAHVEMVRELDTLTRALALLLTAGHRR